MNVRRRANRPPCATCWGTRARRFWRRNGDIIGSSLVGLAVGSLLVPLAFRVTVTATLVLCAFAAVSLPVGARAFRGEW